MQAHGGNVTHLSERYGLRVEKVLDFSANVNPYGPPPEAMEMLRRALSDINRYPDPEHKKLRGSFARQHGVEAENLAVGNGSTELIYACARLFPSPKAWIFAPAFTEYARAVLSAGGAVSYLVSVEDRDFFYDFDRTTVESVTDAELIFIANPNNPTGTLYENDVLWKWVEKVHEINHKAHFVLDEAFLPFTDDQSQTSLIPFAVEFPRVVVLRSPTKLYGIAGLRLGYAVGHAQTLRKLENMMPPWRVNVLAQCFGEHVAYYDAYAAHSREMLLRARKRLIEKMRLIPALKSFNSAANFILAKIQTRNMNSSELAEHLARKGIFIRVCDDFVGLEHGRFFRVAVRKPEDNEQLVNALKEVFNGNV